MAYIPIDKIERLRRRADKLERDAAPKMAEWERNRGDLAYVTQPAGPGRPFHKQRKRAMDRYSKGVEMLAAARNLREEADRLERVGIPEKGDAERARQAQRDALDAVVTVGARVFDPIGGYGIVLKINRKTLRVKYDRGYTWTEEKSRFSLVKGGPPDTT